MEYDTSRPKGADNPRTIYEFPVDLGQDRPFGMLGVEEENKLLIGTVPAYGQLGGALAVYDAEAGQMEHIETDIVRDQSIVSLTYLDGKVVGGTSVWGGLGSEPSETEGKLFVWDLATAAKELEIVPVPGKRAVTGLTVGPDHKIWGMAEGVLFIFDPESCEVIDSKTIIPVQYTDTVWGDAYLETGTDGHVYGTSRGRFFRIDAATKEVTFLAPAITDAKYLAQDEFGNLYFQRNKSDLWKFSGEDLHVKLAEVKLSAPGEAMKPGDTVEPDIAAYLENGRKISNVKDAEIQYTSSNEDIIKVEDGTVRALDWGHAELYAEVTIHGVTVRSNPLTVAVEPDAAYLEDRLDAFQESGDLKGPLHTRLAKILKQAANHQEQGRKEQALKLLGIFIKQLNHEAMNAFISPEAKESLNRDAEALMEVWLRG